MFVAPRMIPYFHAVWGIRRPTKPPRLSRNARALLSVLRHEWEMASSDLREESGVSNRAAFTRALDELQAAMLVIPSDVVYQPKFTYIWTLASGAFRTRCAAASAGTPRCGRSRGGSWRAPG